MLSGSDVLSSGKFISRHQEVVISSPGSIDWEIAGISSVLRSVDLKEATGTNVASLVAIRPHS